MKAIRALSISRCLVVAVMLFSWLVVTNHCALAELQSKLAAPCGHAHCHGDAGKKVPSDGTLECCRVVKASLADKAEFKFDASKHQLFAGFILRAISAPAAPAPRIFLDHGPPRAESFAEIVLQRSLLGHAPPVLA